MNFHLDPHDIEQFNSFYDKMQKNIELSDFYNELLDQSYALSLHYNKNFSFLTNLKNFFEFDQNFLNYFKEYHLETNFKLIQPSAYLNNAFVKNIQLDNVFYLNYAFQKNAYQPYQCFVYDEIEVDKNFLEFTKIGYFNQPLHYLTLQEDQNIWMLMTPHEINTMHKAIQEASNHVLTFGLGMGYFAYMCSLKKEVKSITIIEKNQDIIDLFNRYIFPQFPYPKKINIIHDDVDSFMQNYSLKLYDYLFVDIYRDTTDGLPIYVKLIKPLIHSKIQFRFWIENSLIIMLRRCLINAFYEIVNQIHTPFTIQTYSDYVIELFKNCLIHENITNFQTLKRYLQKQNMIKLLLKAIKD